jgi:hypothetical protein
MWPNSIKPARKSACEPARCAGAPRVVSNYLCSNLNKITSPLHVTPLPPQHRQTLLMCKDILLCLPLPPDPPPPACLPLPPPHHHTHTILLPLLAADPLARGPLVVLPVSTHTHTHTHTHTDTHIHTHTQTHTHTYTHTHHSTPTSITQTLLMRKGTPSEEELFLFAASFLPLFLFALRVAT